MKISNKGIELIKKFEGFSETSYVCSAGYKTIGYGHKILGEEYFRGKRLSDGKVDEWEADILLLGDIEKAELEVNKLIAGVELNQQQYDAIISLVFNIGVEAFRKSTLLKKLLAKDINFAGKEILKWNKSKLPGSEVRVVNRGLTLRRESEFKLYNSKILE